MIYKIDNYINDKNQSIVKKTSLKDDVSESGSVSFIGSSFVTTRMGLMPLEFPFPDSITSITDAFEKFDEVLKNYIEEQINKAQSNLIVPPKKEIII